MDNLLCKIIFVSGTVQGVGFRYFTLREAKKHHLTGTVRNLSDGRVEIIICGNTVQLTDFIDWLYKGGPKSATIKSFSYDDYTPSRSFTNFQVT